MKKGSKKNKSALIFNSTKKIDVERDNKSSDSEYYDAKLFNFNEPKTQLEHWEYNIFESVFDKTALYGDDTNLISCINDFDEESLTSKKTLEQLERIFNFIKLSMNANALLNINWHYILDDLLEIPGLINRENLKEQLKNTLHTLKVVDESSIYSALSVKQKLFNFIFKLSDNENEKLKLSIDIINISSYLIKNMSKIQLTIDSNLFNTSALDILENYIILEKQFQNFVQNYRKELVGSAVKGKFSLTLEKNLELDYNYIRSSLLVSQLLNKIKEKNVAYNLLNKVGHFVEHYAHSSWVNFELYKKLLLVEKSKANEELIEKVQNAKDLIESLLSELEKLKVKLKKYDKGSKFEASDAYARYLKFDRAHRRNDFVRLCKKRFLTRHEAYLASTQIDRIINELTSKNTEVSSDTRYLTKLACMNLNRYKSIFSKVKMPSHCLDVLRNYFDMFVNILDSDIVVFAKRFGTSDVIDEENTLERYKTRLDAKHIDLVKQQINLREKQTELEKELKEVGELKFKLGSQLSEIKQRESYQHKSEEKLNEKWHDLVQKKRDHIKSSEEGIKSLKSDINALKAEYIDNLTIYKQGMSQLKAHIKKIVESYDKKIAELLEILVNKSNEISELKLLNDKYSADLRCKIKQNERVESAYIELEQKYSSLIQEHEILQTENYNLKGNVAKLNLDLTKFQNQAVEDECAKAILTSLMNHQASGQIQPLIFQRGGAPGGYSMDSNGGAGYPRKYAPYRR